MIRLRAEAISTSHSPPPHIILSYTRADTPPSGTLPSGTPPLLPIPLPTSSPPFHSLSTNHRADRPEVTLPPQKRLGIALALRYEGDYAGSRERDISYRITDTWDEMLVDMSGAPATDDTELGRRMTKFTTSVRQDTYKIYTRLDDEQSERQLMAGRLNMLYRDRRAHAHTARLIEAEARMSREALAADRRRQAAITELLAADRKRQAQFIEALKLLKRLQTQMTEFERMFPEESDKIEKDVDGLPDMIHGSVVASKPKTMQDAVEIATELMDKKIRTFAERQIESKRKFENTSRTLRTNNNNNRTRGRTLAWPTLQDRVRRSHTRDLNPYALNATITMMVHVLLNATSATKYNILPVTVGVRQMPTMLTTRRALGRNNNNRGNQVGGGNAPTKVYVVGHAGTNPDSNVVTGTFLLNNRYASILFDTGADMSFVSTAFSSQIDITPAVLDHYYDVELADGRIIRLNTILRGCTLNILNHPFNIDLMAVELGSFDAIIGMDWLVKYQAIIVCAKKIVRIP
ncbi:putative reverse transcriptase domain-containing protein [Tanacetum coccineum]